MAVDKYFIAKKIKIARKKAGYTQEKLAEEIGISSKQLSRIEMANYMPSLPTFLEILRVLKISTGEFGITSKDPQDPVKTELLKQIHNCSEEELQICLHVFEAIIDNINLIKK